MIDQALVNLRPGAHWELIGDAYENIIWHDEEQSKPSKDEVNVEVDRIIAEYRSKEYQRLRKAEYPSLADQLDMQYHDALNGTTTWQDAINTVKAKYPKPEN
jgi:hypothetical protein